MLLVCSLLLAAWPRVLAATREPAPLLRTRVKVGIIVHVERRHVESRVQRAVELFNAGSAFLMIEPIFVFTSDTDTLLRSGSGYTYTASVACFSIVKLREREGQRVDLGRSLKGHLWMVDGGIPFPDALH